MLWLKSKSRLTTIPIEAHVKNEIKAPNIRIKRKIKNEKHWKVENRLFDTSQL